MSDLNQTLITLGLSDKEVKVYLACLELGSATIQEIATKAGIKRTSIYNFLDEMKGKGLVSEIKQSGRVMIIAEDPNTLVQRMETQMRDLQTVLPDLMGIFNRPGNKPKVKYYQGLEGLKKIYQDTLETKETIYAFGDYEDLMTTMDPDYMWAYADERARRGIGIFTIAKKGEWATKAMKRNKAQKREMKLVDKVEFDTEVNIYGNKVALLSFHRPYAGVIIEDRAIAETMKSIWKLVWNSVP